MDSLERSLGELKDVLNAHFAWPLEYFDLLVRGKRDAQVTLAECKLKGPRAKIHVTFTSEFFEESKGSNFLEVAEKQLLVLEAAVKDIQNRTKNRLLSNEDARYEVLRCRDKLLDIKGPLHENQVKVAHDQRRKELQNRIGIIEESLEKLAQS